MNIISKHKDYYDYLQGIYGVDELITLDRSKIKPPPIISKHNYDRCVLYICDVMYEGLYFDGKYHFNSNIKDLIDVEYPKDSKWNRTLKYQLGNWILNLGPDEFLRYNEPNEIYFHSYILSKPYKIEISKSPNRLYNCPILLEYFPYSELNSRRISNLKYLQDSNKLFEFPILSAFNVPPILEPKDIWIMLTDWLSSAKYKNLNSDILTNKEKILSSGFDLKTSFRGVN
ncbi:MAG: hypothetical protein NTW25_08190 [Candidatus Kapabacteria bacterium]|nr:hypothetical protein [Candidatus Kapabacteria bacterium]